MIGTQQEDCLHGERVNHSPARGPQSVGEGAAFAHGSISLQFTLPDERGGRTAKLDEPPLVDGFEKLAYYKNMAIRSPHVHPEPTPHVSPADWDLFLGRYQSFWKSELHRLTEESTILHKLPARTVNCLTQVGFPRNPTGRILCDLSDKGVRSLSIDSNVFVIGALERDSTLLCVHTNLAAIVSYYVKDFEFINSSIEQYLFFCTALLEYEADVYTDSDGNVLAAEDVDQVAKAARYELLVQECMRLDPFAFSASTCWIDTLAYEMDCLY